MFPTTFKWLRYVMVGAAVLLVVALVVEIDLESIKEWKSPSCPSGNGNDAAVQPRCKATAQHVADLEEQLQHALAHISRTMATPPYSVLGHPATRYHPEPRIVEAGQRSCDGLLRQSSPYLMKKSPVLDALECDFTYLLSSELFRKGSSILSVGAGSGEMEKYFQAKYKINVTCIDILPAETNTWTKNSAYEAHMPIEVYDGVSLKRHADRSFDAVIFVSVLHHAAANAPGLLLEAQRVARRWVIIVEDLGLAGNRRRNLSHDASGIFRTTEEWYSLLTASSNFEMALDSVGVAPQTSTACTIGAFSSPHSCIAKHKCPAAWQCQRPLPHRHQTGQAGFGASGTPRQDPPRPVHGQF